MSGRLGWWGTALSVILAVALLTLPSISHAQDTQELQVAVQDGGFNPNWLDAQSGAIRLAVTTGDAAYTLSIDELVDPQALPAGTTTYVGFEAPRAGEFTMRLQGVDGTAHDTGTLMVTQPGF